MKKGNMTVVMVASLIFIIGSTSLLNMLIYDRKTGNQYRTRFENRYLAENSIDLSIGLFEEYIENIEYELQYEKNDDGYFSITDNESPYLIDVVPHADKNVFEVEIIGEWCRNYYKKVDMDLGDIFDVEFNLNTFADKDIYKISRLSKESTFSMSAETDNSDEYKVNCELQDISGNIIVKYQGGQIMCDVVIRNAEIKRQAFKNVVKGTVKAVIDFENADIETNNYQNYI